MITNFERGAKKGDNEAHVLDPSAGDAYSVWKQRQFDMWRNRHCILRMAHNRVPKVTGIQKIDACRWRPVGIVSILR